MHVAALPISQRSGRPWSSSREAKTAARFPSTDRISPPHGSFSLRWTTVVAFTKRARIVERDRAVVAGDSVLSPNMRDPRSPESLFNLLAAVTPGSGFIFAPGLRQAFLGREQRATHVQPELPPSSTVLFRELDDATDFPFEFFLSRCGHSRRHLRSPIIYFTQRNAFVIRARRLFLSRTKIGPNRESIRDCWELEESPR